MRVDPALAVLSLLVGSSCITGCGASASPGVSNGDGGPGGCGAGSGSGGRAPAPEPPRGQGPTPAWTPRWTDNEWGDLVGVQVQQDLTSSFSSTLASYYDNFTLSVSP